MTFLPLLAFSLVSYITASILEPDQCAQPIILCQATNPSDDFDRLDAKYFAKNNLGTKYLADFTTTYSPAIAAVSDPDLRQSIASLAGFVVSIFNVGKLERFFFLAQKYKPNYSIHRVLGALEFVAKLPRHDFNAWKRLSISVLNAAHSSLTNPASDLTSVIEKIGALNRDSDDEFKKYLLQLVSRSAWTGFGSVFFGMN